MWYENRLDLARLIDELDQHNLIDGSDLDAVLYALRKPWKYTVEWEHLQEHGSLKHFNLSNEDIERLVNYKESD